MYDPILGRFLSPDKYVQAPGFTQSYNRYSYCLNNPLSYVDPGGYELITIHNSNGENNMLIASIINQLTNGASVNSLDIPLSSTVLETTDQQIRNLLDCLDDIGGTFYPLTQERQAYKKLYESCYLNGNWFNEGMAVLTGIGVIVLPNYGTVNKVFYSNTYSKLKYGSEWMLEHVNRETRIINETNINTIGTIHIHPPNYEGTAAADMWLYDYGIIFILDDYLEAYGKADPKEEVGQFRVEISDGKGGGLRIDRANFLSNYYSLIGLVKSQSPFNLYYPKKFK
jgi:hypothetical protein